MDGGDLLSLYNYDEFIPAKFERWLNFGASPHIGWPVLDFRLWSLDRQETSLSQI